jgi:hypothetical protein
VTESYYLNGNEENGWNYLPHNLNFFGVLAIVFGMLVATPYVFRTFVFNVLFDVDHILLSRAKNSGRQCHFKVWLDCHKLKKIPA